MSPRTSCVWLQMLSPKLQAAILPHVLNAVPKEQWKGRYFVEDPLTLNLLPHIRLIKPPSVKPESIPGRALCPLPFGSQNDLRDGWNQVCFQSA